MKRNFFNVNIQRKHISTFFHFILRKNYQYLFKIFRSVEDEQKEMDVEDMDFDEQYEDEEEISVSLGKSPPSNPDSLYFP